MKISKKVLVIGLSGVMAVSAVGAVMAQDPGGGDAGRPGKSHILKAGLNSLSEVSGLNKQVFSDGFRAGKSINQVLIENGKDPVAIQAELLGRARERLDKAVADGKLSEEKAGGAYARAAQAIPAMMDRVPTDEGHGDLGRHVQHAGRSLMQSAASTIGLELSVLIEQVRAGQTIAEVAAAKGVAPQTVIDNAVAAANAQIDEAEANGTISAEKAAALKARAAAGVARVVNEGRPLRAGR
jgi:ribosomal protein S20